MEEINNRRLPLKTFVFFRVNPIACLPPWTIKIIFIMDLAMTLNPFVFTTV